MDFSGGVLATCSQTPGDGGDLVERWRISVGFLVRLLKYLLSQWRIPALELLGEDSIFRRENVTKPFKRPGRLSENNVVERWQPGTSGKPGTWRDVQAVKPLFVGPTFVKSHETTPRSERSGMFGDHRIDVPRLMVQKSRRDFTSWDWYVLSYCWWLKSCTSW